MKMTGVKYANATNSTLFTECCGVAICSDQGFCPVCEAEVLPRSEEERHYTALSKQVGGEKQLQKLRDSWRRSSQGLAL